MQETKQNRRQELHPLRKHSDAKKKEKKKECGCQQHNEIVNSKGELLITAKRTSFNITQTLPFFIWGTKYINSLSTSIITSMLPTGVTCTISVNPADGSVVFNYNDGKGNIDGIIVSLPGSLISYAEMLENINTNYMKCNYMLFNCNAGSIPPQLANTDILTLLTSPIIPTQIISASNTSGQKKQQVIIPRGRQMINNSILNLAEIYLRKEPVTAESVWIHSHAYIPSLEGNNSLDFYYMVFISEMFNANEDASEIHK